MCSLALWGDMLEGMFIWGELPADRIIGSYDYRLVVLSLLITMLSSYIALDMAAQLRNERARRVLRFWHIGGAVAMGAGIWAMHFTGMLAYHMGMPRHYDLTITLVSLVIPIIFAYVVMAIIRDQPYETRTILMAAPFLGLGIASMHYVGMAAMQMHGEMRYRPDWFAFSIVIAVVASGAALWLAFIASRTMAGSKLGLRIFAAIVLGAAVGGMHYAGMAAMVVVPHADMPMTTATDEKDVMLAFGVALVALVILGLAVIALSLNRKLAGHMQQEVDRRTEELRKRSEELEQRSEELKQANEQSLKAKEEAEGASIAKSEFLANMSHEIRTPMNAIVGIANILTSRELPPERIREYLMTLQTSSESLLTLINEILDISRIEANAIELDRTMFDLRTLVQEVVTLMLKRAQEKGVSLKLHYPLNLPNKFIGDPLRIRQVLVNLVGNAVKFTRTGEINVSVEVQRTPHLYQISLKVSDTGIGIPTDKLGLIFESFTQVDTSSSRQYGGSGLGLAISKGLVERMGGTIEVASVPEAGSVFTVHLALPPSISHDERDTMPVFDRQALAPRLAVLATQNQVNHPTGCKEPGTACVLLVEDHASNVLVASSFLEEFGYAFRIARGGKEALELFDQYHFDLILMDIQMPDLDGYEVTRLIREQERTKLMPRTPILAMTSHIRVEDRAKCLKAGMDEYIAKPFKTEEFRRKLDLFLKQEA